MRTVTYITCIATLLVAGLAGETGAQVVRTQRGNALDANYRVGSGGLNPRVAGSEGISGQMIVNRQVSGLAGFRGDVPYRASDELGLNLPGNDVRTFRRQAVGVTDVLGGRTYQPGAYMDRTAVLGPDDIAAGLNAPGTNVPQHQNLSMREARQLYEDAMVGYRRLGSEVGTTGRTDVAGRGQYQSVSVNLFRQGDPLVDTQPDTHMLQRLGGSGVFNMPDARERARLAQELYHLHRQGQTQDEQDEQDDNPARIDARVPSGASDVIRDPSRTDDQRSGDPLDLRARPEGDAPARPDPLGDDPQRADPLTNQPASIGQDAFLDLLRGLSDRNAGIRPKTAVAVDLDEEDAEAAPAVISYDDGTKALTLNKLAGTGRDALNAYMRAGQDMLGDGKYYKAAGAFAQASLMDSRNPLAHVGRSLALLGAGEALSASGAYREAVRLFPPTLETRLDVEEMMPVADFRKRLGQLDARLAKQKDPQADLVFLAAVLHHVAGDAKTAAKHAARLRDLAGEDEVFKSTAERILSKGKPASALAN